MGRARLVPKRFQHFFKRQVVVAQHDVELIQDHHVVSPIGDHLLGGLPRVPGRFYVARPVLGLPGEAFAHGADHHLIGEGGKGMAFAGLPLALDELHDADLHAVADRPHGEAEGGGRLSLARPGVDDEEALLDGLGGEDPVAHLLALARLLVGPAVDLRFARWFRFRRAHGLSLSSPSASSASTSWAILARGRHSPLSCASNSRALISASAAGLLSERKARTLSSWI